MTESRSDASETIGDAAAEAEGPAARAEWAIALGEALGALEVNTDFDTVRIVVDRTAWVEVIEAARDQHDLVFFSWLSAIDWSREVKVGAPVADAEGLDERYDVICRLSSITSAHGAHFIARLPKDDATIDTLVPMFGGAAWHEREAAEMFGIEFTGHPGLDPLYLPDAFEGHPLRKSFPLLSREVKPWPGMVDVEAMPSTENIEAEAAPSGDET